MKNEEDIDTFLTPKAEKSLAITPEMYNELFGTVKDITQAEYDLNKLSTTNDGYVLQMHPAFIGGFVNKYVTPDTIEEINNKLCENVRKTLNDEITHMKRRLKVKYGFSYDDYAAQEKKPWVEEDNDIPF